MWSCLICPGFWLFSNFAIFFILRSPSYPPPGCGKNKSKLKSEQDGISKTHKLLRRTCSSTVKAEDVCATKSHRTFGRSLSSDPRAEQTMAIRSHKLLSRACSAAAKQEECITLKPHKVLNRSCSGDPRCEHNSTLKPHKLLSRSYSSNLKMEELDGLKNHKLLSKTYSNAPKSSKMEPFKESTMAESRRLSLTSGLIGILTPSSSSPSQAAVRNIFLYSTHSPPIIFQMCCYAFYVKALIPRIYVSDYVGHTGRQEQWSQLF